MASSFLKKYGSLLAVAAALAIFWRFALPVILPFGLGALLALSAEPLVQLLSRRLKRGMAAGIGVTAALIGTLGILVLLTAVLLRQLGTLTGHVPGLIRTALWGWLKAQLSLSGMSFLILLAGFFLLGIPYAPLWALLIALVDAVPLLGTGTVLIPWALLTFLQGNGLQAMGLLIIYAVTFLTRTAMEPRLVGRQLGLDPLLTLASLYAGFHFWGVGGMLAAPILCVIVKEATAKT